MNDGLQLGKLAALPGSPAEAKLDFVANPRLNEAYVARFTCPEFSSICPVTGQPDFAHIVIDYVPRAVLVESKSLKLFLHSFRNHGAFHEDCTLEIGCRLWQEAAPYFIRVGAFWYPRGGIPIDVFWKKGTPPPGTWLPDVDVPAYRGRG